MNVMKKVTAVLLLTLTAGMGFAGELEDILKGNYEAKGGLDKLKGIKTVTMKGKIVAQGGQMELMFESKVKTPDKLHTAVTLQGMNIQTGINGDDAWMVNPMMGSTDAQDMPAPQVKMMKEQMDVAGPLVGYEDEGGKVEYLGKEEVEGTECFKLKHTNKDGKETTLFLDTESYVEIKAVTDSQDFMGNDFVAHTYFSDYQEVDGMMMAHTMTTKNKEGMTLTEIVLENITVNKDIDDAVFVRPKPATPAEEKKDQ